MNTLPHISPARIHVERFGLNCQLVGSLRDRHLRQQTIYPAPPIIVFETLNDVAGLILLLSRALSHLIHFCT